MGSVAIAAALFSALDVAVTQYAWAQHSPKLPRIAILWPLAPTTQTCGANYQGSSLPCFMDAMRERGYVDGKNASFEFRFADNDYNKLPALAIELVSLRPDVIYTAGPGANAAAKATSTIPIIVAPGGEEMLARLAGNLAHPTRNVTGFTLTSVEQRLKCLQLLKELAPGTSRVAFLVNPDDPGYRDYPVADAAGQLSVTVTRIEARNISDLPQAFAAVVASGADAIYLPDDPTLASTGEARKQIIERALSLRLPLASANSSVAPEGGLVSLGTDRPALARRAAIYVDKILKGAKPADLPVERPSTYKLSLNVKTAKALGLKVPPSLLARADEVIE
jgi:ABC-type uncharacterized transport system, periplasmic component